MAWAMPRRSVPTTGTWIWPSDPRRRCRDPVGLLLRLSNNVPNYPAWQAYFRKHPPPTLIVWGRNDYLFPADGTHPYERDLKNLESHLLDTGHLALEEEGPQIANWIRDLMQSKVVPY